MFGVMIVKTTLTLCLTFLLITKGGLRILKKHAYLLRTSKIQNEMFV